MTSRNVTRTSVACEVKLYLAVPSPSSSLLSSPGLIAAPSPVRHRARFRSGAAALGRTRRPYDHSHISTVRDRSSIAWPVILGW